MANGELWKFFPVLNMLTAENMKWIAFAGIGMWLVFEAIFAYIIIYYVAPRLQKYRKPVPTEIPPMEFYKRIFTVMDTLKDYNIERYLRGFFHNAKLEDIYLDNLASFIAWGVFGNEIDERDQQLIQELIEFTKERYPEMKKLKPGFNPDVKHCAISFEPVPYIHRPLLLYVANGLTEIAFNTFFLRSYGFRFMEVEGLNYWIRVGSSSAAHSSSLPPLLVLHGISPGWSMYTLLIQIWAADRNRTVILANLDAIKIKSMFFFMPSLQQFNTSIMLILRHHRIDKVSIVGHSFGSISAAWLVSKHPHIVTHLTLLDPVSLLLFLPDCVQKFIYSKPQTFVEHLLYFFASREITISYALHRNFIRHTNILWLEDVPQHIGVVIGLATNDEITNPAVQEDYIRQCIKQRDDIAAKDKCLNIAGIHVVRWEGFSHGQIMLSPKPLKTLHDLMLTSERKCAYLCADTSK